MMRLGSLCIAAGHCGPPGAANGGYLAGRLAAFLGSDAEVRLLAPTPLGVSLDVHAVDDGCELRNGAEPLARVRRGAPAFAVPPAPAWAAACEARERYLGWHAHPAPHCFVCGTGRRDGLAVYAGALEHDGRPAVAAPWTPAPALAGPGGYVRPEFLWAALDCPGYYALVTAFRPMLLGTISCAIERPLAAGEPARILGWALRSEGRRRLAATALYDADGRCVARASATWVELRDPVSAPASGD